MPRNFCLQFGTHPSHFCSLLRYRRLVSALSLRPMLSGERSAEMTGRFSQGFFPRKSRSLLPSRRSCACAHQTRLEPNRSLPL